MSGQQDRFPIDAIPCDDLEQAMAAEEAFGDEHIRWRRRPRRGICRHVCRGFHPPSHGMELCPSGHFALRVQFAKAAGATVIATSSSDEKLARLKDLGADHLITHAGNSSSGIPSHATISCGENGSRAANRSRYSSAPGIAVGSWLTPAPARPAAPLPRVQTILSD